MGPSYMGPNFFKEIAKMTLELLGLLLELLLLLLLLLLDVFTHALLRGREAPPQKHAAEAAAASAAPGTFWQFL